MSTNTARKYAELAVFISAHRARAGLKQAEFADMVDSSQQTISRWEAGSARPRQRDLARIAAVLGVSVDGLHSAAGYRSKGDVVATFDKPFPLYALAPDSFERFSADFLQRVYGTGAAVARAGKEGHTQHGIDISVREGGATDVFQCKRVGKFGPARVASAVAAAATVQARQKVLLLASVASPDARAAVIGTDWEIWDQDDISRKVRALAAQDQVELVDQYFRGLRWALLGMEESSPWQSPNKFFEPFLGEKVFGHNWTLVGREHERRALLDALQDSSKDCVLLLAPGGMGKSRLLWEALQELGARRDGPRIRMLVPQVPLTPRSLEDLGEHDTVLVVDDAHDREDLGLLLRHVAASNGSCRLLLSLRPYGLESVRRQAANLSMSGEHVAEVNLAPLSKASAEDLARQVLLRAKGNPSFALTIAEHTYESPLLTVLSAHIAARDELHPQFIGDTEEFRHKVQLEFERVVTQDVAAGADGDRITELLSLIALVQPVAKDDESLLRLIETVSKISLPQAARLLNLLVSAGVLFQRGRTYRLAPDLLTDSIIERCCFSASGSSLGYAETVFDVAPPGYLKNLMLNLGRLDWRKHKGDTSSSELLRGIWAKLKWQSAYNNPHVEAALAVAYYQPRQTIQFAEALIKQGHGQDRHVAEMLKYAAYNMEHAEKAMLMLWRIGRDDDRSQNQHPSHAIRILKELAMPGPNKPIGYVRKVAALFLGLLKRPKELAFKWTPFDVIEGALVLENRVHTATRRSEIIISRFHVDLDAVKDIRQSIRDAVMEGLVCQNLRIAFRAATTLGEFVRGPIGGFHSDSQAARHGDVVLDTITMVNELVDRHHLSAAVLVRVVQSLVNRAYRGGNPIKERVQKLYAQLERDLRTRVVRAMMDAWGADVRALEAEPSTNLVEESGRWLQGIATEVLASHQERAGLVEFLVSCIEEVRVTRLGVDGSSHRFVRMVVDASEDLAEYVLSLHREGTPHILREHAGQALATLLRAECGDETLLLSILDTPTNEDLELIAEGLSLSGEQERRGEVARRAIKQIVESKDSLVLRRGGHLMIQVAREDPAYALEKICEVDLEAAGRAANDYFMLLGTSGLIPSELVGEKELNRLLANLESVPDVSDYWILDFLKIAVKRDSRAVIDLVKRRLMRSVGNSDWSYQALPSAARKEETLALLESQHGMTALLELLNWALDRIEEAQFPDSFGVAVATLCGTFGAEVLEALLGWIHFGTEAHAKVLTAVISEGPRSMLVQHNSDVVRILDEVEPISEEAVEELRSAFWRASFSEVRTSIPGHPTDEDLEMVRVATEVLERLMPLDPAYDLYDTLRREAERNIALAKRECEELEDEA